MSGRISSSKKEAKIAIFFIWSMLITFPAMIALGEYMENSIAADVDMLFVLLISLAVLALACVLLASVVVFIIWFYKAYSILDEKTPNLKYKKSLAVWSWIIPVVNFYLPYLLLKDMYKNIAILTNDSEVEKSFKKLTALNIWWAIYILGWILDIGYYAAIYPDSSMAFNIITYLLIIPSVWLTVKIIRDYCELEAKLV
ncbi:MAG: DUF4328 domain-containing protein [Campylobacteraceae bacterium]|jgi:heme/copper-type cytochrome/quinol oxidase subunit 2|nr:DUF4328 domain-containing protein [Campylobacteraceae bacterium]